MCVCVCVNMFIGLQVLVESGRHCLMPWSWGVDGYEPLELGVGK